MKHTLTLSFALCLIAGPSSAQMPGSCTLLDAGFFTVGWGGLVERPDGGVIICGSRIQSNGGDVDVVLTKLNASGGLEWMKTYASGPNAPEYGQAIVNTSDGGLAVAGQSNTGGIFLMKLQADGSIEWMKHYAHPNNILQMAQNALVQLSDDGFALHIGATAGGDGWMMLRTDGDGEVLWSDQLDFVFGFPMDIAALPNGDLVFTGENGNLGPYDLVFRKDGLTGATEWIHWYTAGADEYIDLRGLVVGPDSTIVVGGSASGPGYYDAFAMALTSAGTPIWSARSGGPQNEVGRDIALDPAGGYVLSGDMREPIAPYELVGGHATRLDVNGQRVWGKFLTHPDLNTIQPGHCAMASDGGVLLTGEAGTSQNYPLFFSKLDADGNSCPYCPSVDVGTGNAMDVVFDADQAHAFTGPWATASDLTAFTVTDIAPTVAYQVCGTTGVEERPSAPSVTIAPNPFSDHTLITLDRPMINGQARIEVRDVLGRLVHTQRIGGTSLTIARGVLATGRYTFRISDDGGSIVNGALHIVSQ